MNKNRLNCKENNLCSTLATKGQLGSSLITFNGNLVSVHFSAGKFLEEIPDILKTYSNKERNIQLIYQN